MKFMKRMAFLALCITHITLTGDKPWYMYDIKKMNRTHYQKNCAKISKVQSIRTMGLIAYNLVAHDKNNPKKQLEEIEAQIKSFEAKLLQKEQNALLEIKRTFHVDDQRWQSWMNSIDMLKKTHKQGMLQAWPNVTHTIPDDLKAHLFSLMKSNNINPYSINLATDITPHSKELAYAQIHINFTTEPLEFHNTYIPHTINFSQKALQLSDREKKGNCAHEIEHLVRQHAVVQIVLKKHQ